MPGLTHEDLDLLREALHGPILYRDAEVMERCVRLCGMQLLQRASVAATANGWRGSPNAFFLTRDGWELMKLERRQPALRRAAV